MMDYSNNPVYEYNISTNDMNICMKQVKDCIDNDTPIRLSSNPRFRERNRFMMGLYNVLNDFREAGINPSFNKVSI